MSREKTSPERPPEPSAGASSIAPPGAAPLEAPAAAGPRPGAFVALRNRDYRVFWCGALVSNTGSWMQTVAQGWLVLELTDSAFMLGLVGFASTFPMLVLLLVGGVYADRVDRRRLLIGTMSSMMACAAALAALTGLGVVSIGHVLALSFLTGIGLAMAAPAYQAFVHDLVGRRDLQNAIALNSAQFNLSRVVGPSLAGLAVGAIGLAGCFGLNAASYLAAIAALALVRPAHRPVRGAAPMWESLREGFAYARERRRVLALLVLTALMSVLAMPYSTLLPIIARDVLGLDASGLGYLFAVGGVGAVAGALSLAVRGGPGRRGRYLLACVIAAGVGTAGLGLARTPLFAGVTLVVISFSATSAIALMNTLLQELVDDRMRGRVLSMYALAFMGTFPIGNLLAGGLAGLLSASAALLLTGVALVAAGAVIAATRASLRRLE
ncbi:MAG TPA: MFS transporter [Gemmatimonadota bacterium]|nr:MFS transporter [Gemmatimonadota bacterium]